MTRVRFWRLALPFGFFQAALYGVGGIVLPLQAGEAARAGWVFAALNLGITLGAPIWGQLVRRVRLDVLEFTSVAGGLLAWLGVGWTGQQALVPLVFVLGLFGSGVLALAPCCVTCAYGPAEWGTTIARMQSWMMGGQVLGLFVAFAAPRPSSAVVFQFLALAAALPVALTMPSLWGQDVEAVVHRPCLEPSALSPCRWTDGLRAGPEVFRLLLPLCAQYALVTLAAAPIYAAYPLLMQNVFAVHPELASLIFAVAGLLAIGTSAALARAARSVPPLTLLRAGISLRLLAVLLLLYAGALTANGVLGAVAFGLLVNGWVVVSVGFNAALAERVPPEVQGQALGLATGLMSLAVIFGSALGGTVAQRAGYTVMIGGSGAILALALLGSLATPTAVEVPGR